MTAERIHPTQPAKRSKLLRGGIMGAALVAASVGALAAPASAIEGQTSGDTTEVNVGVQPGITMTGLTESFTLTGTPGSTQTGAGAVTFNVETNNVAGYAVTVQSQQSTLTPAIPGNLDSIPIGDLKVREGSDAYQAVRSDDVVTVHSQVYRSENGGDALSNDYKIRVPVVNEDTYSTTLDYVATTL